MIIAIYGMACVGKTTVAVELGARWGCAVRHCGEAVKRQCQVMGVTPDLLDANDHAAIDHDTRTAILETRGDFVVEGRFLNAVLAGCSGVKFVRLICSEEERSQRFTSKISNGERFQTRNEADEVLKRRLYNTCSALVSPNLTVDTTAASLGQVVDTIEEWLKTIE